MYHRPSPTSSDRDKRKELPSNNTYTNMNPSPKSPVQNFQDNPTGTNLSRSSSSSANGSGAILELRKFVLF